MRRDGRTVKLYNQLPGKTRNIVSTPLRAGEPCYEYLVAIYYFVHSHVHIPISDDFELLLG